MVLSKLKLREEQLLKTVVALETLGDQANQKHIRDYVSKTRQTNKTVFPRSLLEQQTANPNLQRLQLHPLVPDETGRSLTSIIEVIPIKEHQQWQFRFRNTALASAQTQTTRARKKRPKIWSLGHARRRYWSAYRVGDWGYLKLSTEEAKWSMGQLTQLCAVQVIGAGGLESNCKRPEPEHPLMMNMMDEEKHLLCSSRR
ncbi:hypothetical protein BY996DRAFT_6505941 [Phakopsora pachyrhizi]|nr:hypothetical protein BY996DRAFT_6505941 [Phakopsora pachyrhizi]